MSNDEPRGFWYWAWPFNRDPDVPALMQAAAYSIIALPPLFWLAGQWLKYWGIL